MNEIELRIDRLVSRLDEHPTTRQKGDYRVRITGPWPMRDPNKRWWVAVEPYNDYDLCEGIGQTLEAAMSAAEAAVDAIQGVSR